MCYLVSGRKINMFCPKCGKENQNDAKFCLNCGTNISTMSASTASSSSIPNEQMTFGKAIATCLAKYFDFNGRASRAEYWWFYLFTILLSWGQSLSIPPKSLLWWSILPCSSLLLPQVQEDFTT